MAKEHTVLTHCMAAVCGSVLSKNSYINTATASRWGEDEGAYAQTAWQSEIIALLLRVTHWTMIHTARWSREQSHHSD